MFPAVFLLTAHSIIGLSGILSVRLFRNNAPLGPPYGIVSTLPLVWPRFGQDQEFTVYSPGKGLPKGLTNGQRTPRLSQSEIS